MTDHRTATSDQYGGEPNPFRPGGPRAHEAGHGRPLADHPRAAEPVNQAAMRASSSQMLLVRAQQLRAEAEALELLAKHAVAMEGTPADEALWLLVVNQRR